MGIPYGATLFHDSRELLLNASVQLLLVLLDQGEAWSASTTKHRAALANEESSSDERAQQDKERQPSLGRKKNKTSVFITSNNCANVYRRLLSTLRRPKDLTAAFSGVTNLLWNRCEADSALRLSVADATFYVSNNSQHLPIIYVLYAQHGLNLSYLICVLGLYLPFSYKQIACHNELLVLLWKMLDENEALLSHCLKFGDTCRLVRALVFFMFEGCGNPAKAGMVHICSFILLLLSGERNFGVLLNRAYDFDLSITELPRFSGCHADLLIITLHKLIVAGRERFAALRNCFLTIIGNISPYTKGLSLVSSLKLLNLFEIFSSPRSVLCSQAFGHQTM